MSDVMNVLGDCHDQDPEPTDPSMFTAADYETQARPYIAALEAESVRLREQLAGAVGALRQLVRLKDGPRDDAYRAAKDAAWDAARDVLRTARGQS
jgi:hypothetical protein